MTLYILLFTLIEFLVVVAIIAVLLAIAIPNILSVRKTARCTKLFAELSSLVADASGAAVDTGVTFRDFLDKVEAVMAKLREILTEECVDKTFVTNHRSEFDAIAGRLRTAAADEADPVKKDKLEKLIREIERFVSDQTS